MMQDVPVLPSSSATAVHDCPVRRPDAAASHLLRCLDKVRIVMWGIAMVYLSHVRCYLIDGEKNACVGCRWLRRSDHVRWGHMSLQNRAMCAANR